MENKIYLPGTDFYYRIGNKVFNKRDQELIPDHSGRYKLKVYKGKYFLYRPPGDYNKPERIDINKLNKIPGFSDYYYEEDKVYNKHGKLLRSQNNFYVLKDDEGNRRKIKLNKIII